ncbi:cadmium resistance transporter [Nocardia sp. NPDC004711]
MNEFSSTVTAAVVMFASTNLDDAVMLAMLNVASRSTGAPKQWEIWAGQFLGTGLMVVASGLAATGLRFVPLRWVGLLGLAPLVLGIRTLAKAIRAHRGVDREPAEMATGLWSVAGLILANGGDNISIYTAPFRTMGVADTVLTITVFAIGTAAWCLASSLLVSHQGLVRALQRFSRWTMPAVFIGLGLYILHRSDLLDAVT